MRAYLVGLSAIVAVTAIASPCSAQGFRAEIHGGFDRVNGNDRGDSGAVYGVGLGYDLAVGNGAFVGADFSFDESSQKECEASAIVTNDELCLRAGRDLAAGIRGGVTIGERGKLYALAAYTNARFKSSYTTPAGITSRDAENLDGFRLGAGYQHKFAGNAYGKVEYRYSNYEAGVERHQALVGVGIEF
ncbi:MAG TPA: outer membrane beta-barrel protein [Allosphingosinicella sp.]|jgi:outer membrane immunogenic protein|uniref:outer membrane protein n=1 Tax=Allosphingosinicella sp. TaxID=2823234 RepID=UPI002F2910A6